MVEHPSRHRGQRDSPRVLIVDDDPDILDALSEILEVEGYEVQRARNGHEALRWLEQHGAPDLVLLDLMMPVMDGGEFARSLSSGARPPIIVLSADRNVSTRAREIGALEWLAKPFELAELLAAVRRAVPPGTS
ncbi:MAG TPA: response regulator transcription factor [Myxococcaceae bacterium]|nr:response regulator transcription factor [Myxococcaceae bacterium]